MRQKCLGIPWQGPFLFWQLLLHNDTAVTSFSIWLQASRDYGILCLISPYRVLPSFLIPHPKCEDPLISNHADQ